MSDEKQYYVIWKMEPHPEGITEAELPEGFGASQKGIYISCAEHETGEYSQRFFAFNKEGKEMSPRNLFKAWLMFGQQLARFYELDALRLLTIECAVSFFFRALDSGEEE